MLAQEAAKIIAIGGVTSYQHTKRKACGRIGNSHRGSLPRNFEIERAISSFYKTFVFDHNVILAEMRGTALTVMHWLIEFYPYLVGPVLEGTANTSTPIKIHVSSDVTEEVIKALQQWDVDLRIEERRLKLSKSSTYLPTLIFFYQDYKVAITVFTLRQQHQHPKSKIQNCSMERMNIKSLTDLLNQNLEPILN